MINDSLREEISQAYQNGRSSIQDIARYYRVSVDQVLEIIGESNLGSVQSTGDLIDQTEVGPGASINYGVQFKVPFDIG